VILVVFKSALLVAEEQQVSWVCGDAGLQFTVRAIFSIKRAVGQLQICAPQKIIIIIGQSVCVTSVKRDTQATIAQSYSFTIFEVYVSPGSAETLVG